MIEVGKTFGKHKDFGECNRIRQVVKDIDKRFDCYYDGDNNKYVITQYDNYFDSVSPTDLCKDFFDKLRRVVWINIYGSIGEEVDKHNAKLEQESEAKKENIIHEMAKDMYKPLRKKALGV